MDDEDQQRVAGETSVPRHVLAEKRIRDILVAIEHARAAIALAKRQNIHYAVTHLIIAYKIMEENNVEVPYTVEKSISGLNAGRIKLAVNRIVRIAYTLIRIGSKALKAHSGPGPGIGSCRDKRELVLMDT